MPLVVKNGDLLTVSGSLATDVACCCDDQDGCPCRFPTEWRITDSDGNVYAKGLVVAIGGPQCETVVPSLEDLPSPFTPLFYWATGEINFLLELLGCNEEAWDTLDSWSATISLCDGGRYPSQPLDGPWQPPGPCRCKNQQNADDGIEECDPCPDLTAGFGDGQAWRDPQPGTGEVFTGEIDGEWTNLLNWEDANGLTPAGSLPGVGTNVSVEANVTSTAVAISVGELTIQAGVEFSVAASAADLHCYGAIERNGDCGAGVGVVTVSGEAFVYGGGRNNGEIVNALVKFSGGGFNDTDGVVTGDARFDDTSRNDGTITGDAEFYDTATNFGTVGGDAVFNNGAQNATADALVKGNAEFNDSSWNYEGTVEGNAVFNATSKNDGNIDGDAEFNGDSWNGYEQGGGVGGTATFRSSANNASTVSVGVFYDTSKNTLSPAPFNKLGYPSAATFNNSSVNLQFVINATFNGDSANEGTVDEDATFNGDSINRGDVTGTATFNGCSWNDGGTAGTFIPNPPPSAYPC